MYITVHIWNFKARTIFGRSYVHVQDLLQEGLTHSCILPHMATSIVTQ